MAMAVAVAGADVDAALPRIVVTEDGRRMRLADEETLRYFLSRPLRRPPMMRTYTYSAELMRRMGLGEQEVDTLLLAFRNEQAVRRIHADGLHQYSARGYAYVEIPDLYPDDDDMEHEQAMGVN